MRGNSRPRVRLDSSDATAWQERRQGLQELGGRRCWIDRRVLHYNGSDRTFRSGAFSMVVASSHPHIEADEKGTPHIGKTRYEVLHLAAEHYHYSWSADELLRQHPDLRPEEVYAALAYFYDHYESVLAQKEAFNERGEASLQSQTLTREQLLQRKSETKG